MHYKRLIFILIDGAPYEIFKSLVENGDLPNIKKHVADQGCLKKAISVFPSTTGPALIPHFMGVYPGTVNIPGNQWLSKSHYYHPYRFKRPGVCNYLGIDKSYFEEDLPPDMPTLFHYFSPASNIYIRITRGCPPAGNLTRGIKPLMFAYGYLSNHWRYIDQVAGDRLYKAVEAGDNFVACIFPTVDALSHSITTQAPRIIQLYREIDVRVGDIVHILQKTNTLEETLILITSDHGMSNTHTHIDIPQHLDDGGWRCVHYPNVWKQFVEAASMVSGNGMSHLYFKNSQNGRGWGEPMTFEQLHKMGVVSSLIELEGLRFVAGQSETGNIIVQNKNGQGIISWHSEEANNNSSPSIMTTNECSDSLRFSYKFTGTDPLGYGVSYENLSSTEALQLTYDSPSPDGIVQLWQIFKSDRTGDLVLNAESGYDLRSRYKIMDHRASHGGLIPEHLYIPLASNHPLDERYIRSVDIFPTVLNLCGHTIDHAYRIDGRIVK